MPRGRVGLIRQVNPASQASASAWQLGALVAGIAVCMLPSPAWAEKSSEDTYAKASFCAAAILAGVPAPRPGEEAPSKVLVDFVSYWLGRAHAEGSKQGLAPEQVFKDVNALSTGIHDAFKAGTAPFYDLVACDEAEPSVLWDHLPEEKHAVSLDRLADDREVEIYQSLTGRLRATYSNLSVEDVFALDVRILALGRAVGQSDEADLGALQYALGGAFEQRQIGDHARNFDFAIKAFTDSVTAFDSESAAWAHAQERLCFDWYRRQVGDRADNLERALGACEAALRVFERVDDRQAWANTQLILAAVWHDRMRGDHAVNIEHAIAADRAALTVKTRVKDPIDWATAQSNLGAHLSDRHIESRQDDVEAAITAYEAAQTVISRGTAHQGWIVLATNLAPLYAQRTKGDRAANQEQALALLDEVRRSVDASDFLRSMADLGRARIYRARLRGGRTVNLETAVRLYRSTLLGDPPFNNAAIYIGGELGSVLIELGRYDEAADALRIAVRDAEALIGLGLNEAETRNVLAEARDIYTLSAYAAAKLGDPARALSLLSAGRARQLFTALAADNLDLSPEDMSELRSLRGKIHRLEVELEAGARNTSSRGPSGTPALDALTRLRERAEALYSKGTAATLKQPTPAEAAADTALVAPVITDHGAAILVVAPGGKVTAFDAPTVTHASLNVLYSSWREVQGGHLTALELVLDLVQSGLGNGLGDCIRKALLAAGVAKGEPVIIMPDGVSGVLPLSLARIGGSGPSLLEDYEISFTPNLAALVASRRRAAAGDSRSLGFLQAPPTAKLRHAPVEESLVSAGLAWTRVKALDGSDKESLLGDLRSLSYWHFATHGSFYWPDPAKSGILIDRDGGRLQLSDLVDPTRNMGTPRLVVLSACDTGLSDVLHNPDEFTGLPSGFIFAGAAGVVASLWRVDDFATTLLMGRFYDLHLGKGMRPARALREAQLWLRDASLASLQAYVDAKAAGGVLTGAQAEMLRSALDSAGDRSAGWHPFELPFFWGAFVFYGN